MKYNKKTQALVLSFAFITVVLWASAFVFTKVALEHFTPEALGALRYLFASVLLLIFAIIKKISLPRLKDIPIFLISGLLGFALYVYAFNKGALTVSTATSSILVSTAPIITAIFAGVFYKEKIKTICWLAIAFEFLGIVIIALNDGVFSTNMGITWILLAAFSLGMYNVLQRKLLKNYTPFEVTVYSIFSGTILLSIFLKDGFTQLISAPTIQIINVACLGFFPGALGYLLWAIAISKANKVTTVTNFMFTTPLLSTIFGLIVIGEVPSSITVLGGIIIVGSSALFQRWNTEK